MFCRQRLILGVLTAATLIEASVSHSCGQGFWYPGSGGACQNSGVTSFARPAPRFQAYPVPMVNQPYAAAPMAAGGIPIVPSAPGFAPAMAMDPMPATQYPQIVEPTVQSSNAPPVEVVPRDLKDSAGSSNDVVNLPLADRSANSAHSKEPNSDEQKAFTDSELTAAAAVTEKLRAELADAMERARLLDERVYAAEKAAAAAQQASQEKQDVLAKQLAEMEAKLRLANNNNAETARNAARLRRELEKLKKTNEVIRAKVEKEMNEAKALSKAVETRTQELRRVQSKLAESQATARQAESKAAEFSKSRQSKVSPGQLQALESKLKTIERRLEKTLADKETLSNKLNQTAKNPQANPSQLKAPQRPRRPGADLQKRRDDRMEPAAPEEKSDDQGSSKQQDTSEQIATLKEKVRTLEETMKVKLEQSKSRISNRIEQQKKQLLNSGLKQDDSRLIDLDQKLQAELNNSATKIRSEFAQKVKAVQAIIDELKDNNQ